VEAGVSSFNAKPRRTTWFAVDAQRQSMDQGYGTPRDCCWRDRRCCTGSNADHALRAQQLATSRRQ
jgi:hypothetical protein